MRPVNRFLVVILALVAACTSSTDPDDPGTNSGAITVVAVTGLPTVGGDVTSIALLPGGGVIALIDGSLYTVASPTAIPQRMGTGNGYLAFGRAPDGDVYAVTETAIHSFDNGSDPPRSTPLDPLGPLAANGRVESASVTFSASGEPFITMMSSYPRMYLSHSSDNGATWRNIALPYAPFMTSIAFGPNGKLYAAGSLGFYVSTNDGVTWQTKDPALMNYSGKMTIASDGSIYYWIPQVGALHVSRDDGSTFFTLSELNRAPFYIDIKEGSGGTLYALASKGAQLSPLQPTTLLKSTDRGATWTTVLNANGRALAINGSTMVMGIGGDNGQLGGIYWSSDAGTTWTASGMRDALYVNDIAFDRNGSLMALVDNALFRRTTTGWQLLGSQGRNYVRVAANSQGAIAVAAVSAVYHSSDNGSTFRESAITDYIPGVRGSLAVPALIARPNGDFLMSLTTYDQAGNGFYAGALYRVGNDGVPQPITGISHTFRTLVEDRSGNVYGAEESLDQISSTFRTELYTSTYATTWTKVPAGTQTGASYNSHNRYVRVSSNTELRLGTTGGSEDAARELRGFSTTNNGIARMVFGPDDRLYMTALSGGLFATAGAIH